jgi:hypothetical protein
MFSNNGTVNIKGHIIALIHGKTGNEPTSKPARMDSEVVFCSNSIDKSNENQKYCERKRKEHKMPSEAFTDSRKINNIEPIRNDIQ